MQKDNKTYKVRCAYHLISGNNSVNPELVQSGAFKSTAILGRKLANREL
jgi:hypothetical protein